MQIMGLDNICIFLFSLKVHLTPLLSIHSGFNAYRVHSQAFNTVLKEIT